LYLKRRRNQLAKEKTEDAVWQKDKEEEMQLKGALRTI
jgi:hypothetical protein